MIEYPEGPGCYNEPSFVKGNPLNNESYLEKCCEASPEWADILRETHAKIEAIAPGYNIAQIKAKFGGLRYYIDMPEWWSNEDIDDDDTEAVKRHNDLSDKVSSIISEAEVKVYAL